MAPPDCVDDVLRALSDEAVVLAPLNEVLREAWSAMSVRRAYEAVFDDLVEHQRAAIKAARERDALHSEFGA